MFGKQLTYKARSCILLQVPIGNALTRRNFGGRSERVAHAMSKLAKSLDKAGIDYCVMGGNALHAHGYERATIDVDVLLTKEGLSKFVETHVGRGYSPRFKGAKTKFRNTADNVPIDILLAGSYPGESQTEVPFPEPKEIAYEESFFGSGDQIIKMVDQSIDQCSGIIPMSGVHYHPCRFIDHKNLVIFINDIQGNVFWGQ